MRAKRAIEFVKALEREDRIIPRNLWNKIYYIIRKQSVDAGFELVKNLSKEVLGKELTHEEIISAMNYIENIQSLETSLQTYVSSSLYAGYSQYSYMVQKLGKFRIKDKSGVEEYEKLGQQLQEKRIDQTHIYIALLENYFKIRKDAFVFSFEDSLNIVSHYMKKAKSNNYTILCVYNAYKGFDTMESLLDYVKSYPDRTFLIYSKQNPSVRMEIERDRLEDDSVVYIEYWREYWSGLPVDGVKIVVNMGRLKEFIDTYGKSLVMEYMDYLFREKEYLSSAINFCEEYERNVEKVRIQGVEVNIAHDSLFVNLRARGLNFGEHVSLAGVLEDIFLKERLIPTDFLSFLAARKAAENMWHLTL